MNPAVQEQPTKMRRSIGRKENVAARIQGALWGGAGRWACGRVIKPKGE